MMDIDITRISKILRSQRTLIIKRIRKKDVDS